MDTSENKNQQNESTGIPEMLHHKEDHGATAPKEEPVAAPGVPQSAPSQEEAPTQPLAVPQDADQQQPAPRNTPDTKGSSKPTKKVLLIVVPAVAVITAVVAAIVVWQSRVDQEAFEVGVKGSDTVVSGATTEFQVGFANNDSRKTMEQARLQLEVPEGFELVESELDLASEEDLVWELGDIQPGTEQVFTVKARFYANANDTLDIRATLDFVPSGLGQNTTIEGSYSPGIEPPALAVDLDAPQNADAGSNISYELEVKNNGIETYENFEIEFLYPDGFTFASSTPEPKEDSETTWAFDMLEVGESIKISVSGRLEGITDEKKNVGIQLGNSFNGVHYVQIETSDVTVIASPTVAITQSTDDGALEAGKPTRYSITVKNTGNASLTNLVLKTRLDSLVIDPSTIAIDTNGIFEDGSIVWDSTVVQQLKVLEPNQEFTVSFQLATYENLTPQSKEFTIVSTPTVTIGSQEVGGQVVTTKIKTRVDVGSTASPFDKGGNPVGTGPTTPKVGQTTTYRTNWSVTNFYNDITNAKLTCTIPLGAKYTGNLDVSGGEVSFNESTKVLTWSFGAMTPKTFTSTGSSYTGYFDITISPTAPNVDSQMDLTNNCVFTAKDSFTEQDVSVEVENLVSESVRE